MIRKTAATSTPALRLAIISTLAASAFAPAASAQQAPGATPADEAELLTLLRPGLDGVILSARRHRATFLPQVWEQLPDPAEFLAQLRLKAGLPPGYWGPDVEVETYEVTAWRESEPGVPAARAESPALPEAPATPGSWPAWGEP